MTKLEVLRADMAKAWSYYRWALAGGDRAALEDSAAAWWAADGALREVEGEGRRPRRWFEAPWRSPRDNPPKPPGPSTGAVALPEVVA